MHERCKKNRRNIRNSAAACLAAVLLLPFLAAPARAVSASGTAPQTSSPRMLVPVGHTVGIKLFSRGVLVVDLPQGASPAREAGLRRGDVILSCNGTAVTSAEQFQGLVQAAPEAVRLGVRRGSTAQSVTLTPQTGAGGGRSIGAWVRDSMAGIGTVTFYDPATGVFGALGHGITDPDTAQLMPFASGSLLPSAVKAVKRGTAGSAGELRGDFMLDECLGRLDANTSCGIFGTLAQSEFTERLGQAVPAAAREEVHTGAAQILANVEGDSVRRYQAEITRVSPEDGAGRNLLLTVTDPALLAATGGIVQGMSGSPILQDGKLVGAVTHVLVNDPTRGYGIFIETMLKETQTLQEAAG
jgi:stage IV sporulation protein B